MTCRSGQVALLAGIRAYGTTFTTFPAAFGPPVVERESGMHRACVRLTVAGAAQVAALKLATPDSRLTACAERADEHQQYGFYASLEWRQW